MIDAVSRPLEVVLCLESREFQSGTQRESAF
jgi:hypothetical protein